MERDGEEDGVEDVDEDFAEGIVHPYDPAKTKIDSVQTTLDTLLKRLQYDEIDMQPTFQREAGLWSPTKMSRLIESVLIRIPLPAFYFDGSSDDRWLVVDGVQRLSALQRFVLEGGDRRLRLVGLEYLRDVVGMTHDELPRSLQRRIDETQVTLHIIRPGTPLEVKYNIFRRINTGGLVLTPQEIRHALNPGPALAFLAELAKSEAFVAATDGSVDPRRMLDRELVLRFCAFTLRPPTSPPTSQEGNVDRFLTDALDTLNRSTDRYDDLRGRFIRAMEAARHIFGNDAFRKRLESDARRNPINKALFEAWAFWLGQASDDEIRRLIAGRDRIRVVMMGTYGTDPSFMASISVGTGDPRKVRHRFKVIGALIQGILAEGDLDGDLGSGASEFQGV